MLTIEEKIEMAAELGLNNWANQEKEKIEMEREVKNLSAMKFKITTEDEIRKKICSKRYWDWKGLEYDAGWNVAVIFGVGIFAFSFLIIKLIGLSGSEPIDLSLSWAIPGTLFGIMVIPFLIASYRKPIMASGSLYSWIGNLPSGAFLALKEAKGKGLGCFRIYYPCTERHARIKSDPVIVGYREPKMPPHNKPLQAAIIGAPMIEIFAWDDGKIQD